MRRLLCLLFVILSGPATAVPISLSDALYNTSAYAELDADSDGINADSSPPSGLPLFSHAALQGLDDSVEEFANADAIADDSFLSVSSEAQGETHHAGALAEASLALGFGVASQYLLALDFESLLELIGGDAGATLSVVVSAGAQTLLDEVFTHSGSILRRFALAQGETGLLEIGLVSNADAFGTGDSLYAFNLASVNVTLTAVPSPSPLLLLGAALWPAFAVRRARRVRHS